MVGTRFRPQGVVLRPHSDRLNLPENSAFGVCKKLLKCQAEALLSAEEYSFKQNGSLEWFQFQWKQKVKTCHFSFGLLSQFMSVNNIFFINCKGCTAFYYVSVKNLFRTGQSVI